MDTNQIKFDERGLVPVVTQDIKTGEVLMLAYMTREALDLTISTGKVHYWSRSMQKLWQKGETSGNYQTLRSISYDCDGDAILVKVEQKGNACHTGNYSCFHKRMYQTDDSFILQEEKISILEEIYEVIQDRVKNPKEGSYTNYLFNSGLDKMLKKVGEEASEVIIASKNGVASEVRYEVADLFYHILVVLVEQGISLDDIFEELRSRR
ncbi:MAG: bifunctional phosphoribosyl-AMP cyclohydrolase/phosphoribosyl-ATP diphosphatase HisIE [Clostridia bacterium]|jgi:phosphoribosyl-ATP pyrophosphohydrolase/phosphoribosyl-AMP cyclohydrolase